MPPPGILPLIAGRWSSRAIDPARSVETTLLDKLFEAARWAPSAFNSQPWRFLSFGPEDSNALELARSSLLELNSWALSAPRLLFALSLKNNPTSGKTDPYADYTTGMATGQMALQAAEEGLVFHQMAGFSSKVVRENFSVSDNFAIITAIAIGWPGSSEKLSSKAKTMETNLRQRKPLSDLVFSNGKVPMA